MKRNILGIALFFSLSAGAQKVKFYEGFVITASGDTLRGFVHWKKNSTRNDNLLFKRTENEEAKQLSWNELKYAYSSHDKQALLIKTVTRSLEYIDPSDFLIKMADSVAVETIPLTPLYVGSKLSLYQYFDKGTYFFIYDGERTLQLVQKYRYLTNNEKLFYFQRAPRYYTFNEYHNLLLTYYDFDSDKKMRYILNDSQYEERSLYTLISRMDKKLQ